jgi:hypothetical protein
MPTTRESASVAHIYGQNLTAARANSSWMWSLASVTLYSASSPLMPSGLIGPVQPLRESTK